MKLFVATDIFGDTPELQVWLAPIVQASGGMLELVSPYKTPLAKELVAPAAGAADELVYQQFLAQGGLSAYVEKLQQRLQLQQEPFVAIGFSAGAAALWQLAASPQPGLQQLFAFYGGQIRHHAELTPLVSTTLIWTQETHFDVAQLHQQLHQQLAQRPLVSSVLTHFEHGFINPYSKGFNHKAASDYQHWLIAKMSCVVKVT
ncbi:hypothetical protein EOE67_12425 [Rheinheimera riviphila]|uniref:Dienelactone hydrolase domain-containing protein n=1 Tax=Rheinheimera riviphila TaxID=1834037 RepID=A0A437QRH5_9GAMM|nr:dienelactone hydrolase family protein [Rheinheimera riviphila]RVU37108.1 hypothetical protein EOE67_12425 [Rheinheimera riviphila]